MEYFLSKDILSIIRQFVDDSSFVNLLSTCKKLANHIPKFRVNEISIKRGRFLGQRVPVDLESFEKLCQSNYLHLVKYMINRGACWWQEGFNASCLGGNYDIVEFFVSNINEHKIRIDWRAGLLNIGTNNNKHLYKLIPKRVKCWYMVLYGACYNGHDELLELLNRTNISYWCKALQFACLGGHVDIILSINSIISDYYLKFNKKHDVDWNICLIYSCISGNEQAIATVFNIAGTIELITCLDTIIEIALLLYDVKRRIWTSCLKNIACWETALTLIKRKKNNKNIAYTMLTLLIFEINSRNIIIDWRVKLFNIPFSCNDLYCLISQNI